MIELFIFYVAFSYFYMAGVIIDYHDSKVDNKRTEAALLVFLFSPVTMPLQLGMN